MKYTDFVKLVAREAQVTNVVAKKVLDSSMNLLKDVVVSGDEVVLNGVGKFSKKLRSERMGTNPMTGEKVTIPASNVVTFKTSKEFKEQLNQ